MRRSSHEPFVWLLFSAGGMVTALLVPVLLLLFGVVFPLDLADAPTRTRLLAILGPVSRIGVFALCTLALFHSAHRLRHLLRDGLRLRRHPAVLAVACYGTAVVGCVASGGVLL